MWCAKVNIHEHWEPPKGLGTSLVLAPNCSANGVFTSAVVGKWIRHSRMDGIVNLGRKEGVSCSRHSFRYSASMTLQWEDIHWCRIWMIREVYLPDNRVYCTVQARQEDKLAIHFFVSKNSGKKRLGKIMSLVTGASMLSSWERPLYSQCCVHFCNLLKDHESFVST